MLPLTLREALAAYRADAGPKFAAIVARYVGQEGSFGDAGLRRYVEGMLRDGYRPATVDLHIRTIRAFCRRFGMQPPRLKGWRFDPATQSERVAFAPEVVARLITAARSGAAGWLATAHLALGSTYGMRVGELERIRPEDVDFEGQRIYIRSEKGSRMRWCWLPPQVADVLPQPWPAEHGGADRALRDLWEASMDVERPHRAGWHALRRALARDLLASGVSEQAAVRFLRWSRSGDGPVRLLDLYSHPTSEATATGVQAARTEDEGRRDHDAEVWDRHPYLPLWR